MVSFSQIVGIFNTYDLLPQSYKALPSNDNFCKYWVYETENLKKCTVRITDCLQNAYVYQLSGMVMTSTSHDPNGFWKYKKKFYLKMEIQKIYN